MKMGGRKSKNVEGVHKAERPERPGQYGGPFRDPKTSRPVPGGVQGAAATSQALMGSDQAKRLVGAAAKSRALPKKNPNPFAKARSK